MVSITKLLEENTHTQTVRRRIDIEILRRSELRKLKPLRIERDRMMIVRNIRKSNMSNEQ